MSSEFLDFTEYTIDAMDNAEMLLHDISYAQFEDDLRTNSADVDTMAIAMRWRKLDSYLRTLRQMQAMPLDEYLSDDNVQNGLLLTVRLSL